MNAQSERILLLEDHPTHRNVMAFNLTKAGFKVTTATEAAKALSLAKHEHFDLIIADYYLPDYPGTDLVRSLRDTDEYRHTPVILVTGRAEELDREHLAEELSLLVLGKPFRMADLVATVSKCLALANSAS